MTGNHPGPPQAPEGLRYVPVPAEGWQVADTGYGCRYGKGGTGKAGQVREACGEPGVFGKLTGNPLQPLEPYCAAHASRKGLWADGGHVWRWQLQRPDGTPVPGNMCDIHGVPIGQCPADATHRQTVRAGGEWDDMAVRAADAGLSASEGAERALRAWAETPDGRLAARIAPGARKRMPDGRRRVRSFYRKDALWADVQAKAERLGITPNDAVVMALRMWAPARSANPGAAVFREPGAEVAHVTPVPQAAGRTRKQGAKR